jgi:hypothetical protein
MDTTALDSSKSRLRSLRLEAESILALLAGQPSSSDTRTTASDLVASELGGAFTDYLFGTRRLGRIVGRKFSQQSRRNQRAQLESSASSRISSVLAQLENEVIAVKGEIDARTFRSVRSAIGRARTLSKASSAARACLRIVGHLEQAKPQARRAPKPPFKRSERVSSLGRFDLRAFEQELRQFIAGQLSARLPDWWEKRIPQLAREQAERRMRQRDRTWPWSKNNDHAPIHFVDFKDYAGIITEDRNWEEIFKPYFGDKEVIRVKLRELEPIRIDLAHARDLSRTDEVKLRLYVGEITQMIRGGAPPS